VPSLSLGRLLTWERVDPTARRPRGAGTSTFWIFSIGSATLLFMGWLLPWFVRPTSSGIGFSPMDVVSSAPTGIGTFLVYLLGIGMLVMVLSPFAELFYRARKRAVPARMDQVRVLIAVFGLVCTVVVFLLTRVIQEEQLFGPIDTFTITDSAVWLTMVGYVLAAAAYGLRGWVIRRPTTAFAAIALPVGILLPLMFHQAPVFILWAAGSLGIYTLLALGLNVVVGFAGLLDLGYAAFFAIGAYTCGSLASPKHSIHLPLWVLIFLGAAVASMFGAVLGAPTLRLRGDYLAIVTLGFGEIIPDLATNNIGKLTGGPDGISSIDQPIVHLPFATINFGINKEWYYWSVLLVVIVVIVLLRNLEHSRVGRAWVALREDEVAAAATGINTTSTKLLAFAIGASVSGLAGAFYGSIVTIVSPDDFSFSVSVSILSIIVLGGIGNITGVIVGSFVLTFVIFWMLQYLNEWSATLGQTINVPSLGNIDYSQYTYMIYGVALILMMLLRPGGLIPSRARQIELTSGGEEESLAAVQGIA
jgi:branched-chain amino acid transport system permease protein